MVPSVEHAKIPGWNFHLLTALLGLAGIVALFLPFTSDESPVSAAAGQFWRLALPFFLAVLVTLSSLRWIVAGRLSRFEVAAGCLASISAACLTLTLYLQDIRPSDLRDWISLLVAPIVLIMGGVLVVRGRRRGLPGGLTTLMSLQVAYLANCLLCLIAFFGEWQAGAYFALLTALVYLAQIAAAGIIRSGQSPICHEFRE